MLDLEVIPQGRMADQEGNFKVAHKSQSLLTIRIVRIVKPKVITFLLMVCVLISINKTTQELSPNLFLTLTFLPIVMDNMKGLALLVRES